MTVLATRAGHDVVTARPRGRGADGHAPVGPREARWAAVALLAFLVPLPLQSQILAVTPLGVLRWFHFGALAMTVIYLLASRRTHGVLRELWLIVAAMTLMTLLCVVSAAVYDSNAAEPVQHFVYFLIGLGVATVAGTALAHEAGRRTLAWCAPLAVTWSLVEFEQNLRANGISAIASLQQALIQVDPNVLIFGVFREGLSTAGDTPAPASIRHEVMAALLVAILVTCLATRLRPWMFALSGLAVAVGAAVILLSLSRSVLVAVVLGGLVALLRAFLRMSFSRAAMIGVVVGVVALAVAGSELGGLLYSRLFDDSGSYQARYDSLGLSANEISNRLLSGGPDLVTSTHTLFFDVLFKTGWFGGLLVLVVVGVVARYGLHASRRYMATRSVPDIVAVTAAALVLVRLFTSGNGYLHQTEWAAFGIVVAVSWLRRPDPPHDEAERPVRAQNPQRCSTDAS